MHTIVWIWLPDPWSSCGIHVEFLRNSCGVPDEFLRSSWKAPEEFLRSSWGVLQEFLRSSWGVPEEFLRSSWGVAEESLRSAWGVPEEFLGNCWGVPGELLRIPEEFWGWRVKGEGLEIIVITDHLLCFQHPRRRKSMKINNKSIRINEKIWKPMQINERCMNIYELQRTINKDAWQSIETNWK